jgi:hypothetical protein
LNEITSVIVRLKIENITFPAESEFHKFDPRFQIYTGNDTQFRVSGLDPRTEYAVRVTCVRVPASGIELDGVYSPPGIFSTSAGDSGSGSASGKDTKSVTASKLGLFSHVRFLTLIAPSHAATWLS